MDIASVRANRGNPIGRITVRQQDEVSAVPNGYRSASERLDSENIGHRRLADDAGDVYFGDRSGNGSDFETVLLSDRKRSCRDSSGQPVHFRLDRIVNRGTKSPETRFRDDVKPVGDHVDGCIPAVDNRRPGLKGNESCCGVNAANGNRTGRSHPNIPRKRAEKRPVLHRDVTAAGDVNRTGVGANRRRETIGRAGGGFRLHRPNRVASRFDSDVPPTRRDVRLRPQGVGRDKYMSRKIRDNRQGVSIAIPQNEISIDREQNVAFGGNDIGQGGFRAGTAYAKNGHGRRGNGNGVNFDIAQRGELDGSARMDRKPVRIHPERTRGRSDG